MPKGKKYPGLKKAIPGQISDREVELLVKAAAKPKKKKPGVIHDGSKIKSFKV